MSLYAQLACKHVSPRFCRNETAATETASVPPTLATELPTVPGVDNRKDAGPVLIGPGDFDSVEDPVNAKRLTSPEFRNWKCPT
jgi:hypothetical protein